MKRQIYSLCRHSEHYDALDAFSKGERVVFYCGAGVSISRTSLTWKGLLQSLVQQLPDNCFEELEQFSEEVTCKKSFLELIACDYLSPLHAATIYTEIISKYNAATSVKNKLISALRNTLYAAEQSIKNTTRFTMEASLRQSPTDFTNVLSKLIFAAALIKKNIIVITTNYDTFLEQELRFLIKTWKNNCKIRINILHATESLSPQDFKPEDSITFLYLHGRVPPEESLSSHKKETTPDNQIVFSERDYVETAASVSHSLSIAASKASSMLILGASVEDKPLLSFLQNNKIKRDNPKSQSDACREIILVKPIDPIPPLKERLSLESLKMKTNLERLRYEHLGINHFLPMQIFSDIPVVLTDLIYALLHNTSSQKPPLEYKLSSHFLENWSHNFSKKLRSPETIDRIYNGLNHSAKEARKILTEILGDKYNENLVVCTELWIRGIEPAEGDTGRIVRIGVSGSKLFDSSMRRTESLYRRFTSRTAAAKTIQLNSPIFEPLNQFGEAETASRWQAFYAVPISHTINSKQTIVGSIVIALGLREVNGMLISKSDRKAFQSHIKECANQMFSEGALNFIKLSLLCQVTFKNCIEERSYPFSMRDYTSPGQPSQDALF